MFSNRIIAENVHKYTRLFEIGCMDFDFFSQKKERLLMTRKRLLF